ncbi:MAG: hypothetical protein KGL92_15090, partial [Gammaproteobacteria bacterium]|nr:hypothetical protein [Gammaproteobacteria bacterium]
MPDLSATSAQVAAALKRRASAATLAVPTVARCWLEHNLPQAAALLLRVGRDARRATVAAVVGLPPGMVGSALTRSQAWLEPGVALGRIRRYGDPAALAASIRLPKRLARHACWSVPLSVDPGAINLLLVLNPSSADVVATRRALRRAVKVLEPIASAQTHSFGETHPAINAKRQWEITVDL